MTSTADKQEILNSVIDLMAEALLASVREEIEPCYPHESVRERLADNFLHRDSPCRARVSTVVKSYFPYVPVGVAEDLCLQLSYREGGYDEAGRSTRSGIKVMGERANTTRSYYEYLMKYELPHGGLPGSRGALRGGAKYLPLPEPGEYWLSFLRRVPTANDSICGVAFWGRYGANIYYQTAEERTNTLLSEIRKFHTPWELYRDRVRVSKQACFLVLAKAFGLFCPLCKKHHPLNSHTHCCDCSTRLFRGNVCCDGCGAYLDAVSKLLGGFGYMSTLSGCDDCPSRVCDLCPGCQPVAKEAFLAAAKGSVKLGLKPGERGFTLDVDGFSDQLLLALVRLASKHRSDLFIKG